MDLQSIRQNYNSPDGFLEFGYGVVFYVNLCDLSSWCTIPCKALSSSFFSLSFPFFFGSYCTRCTRKHSAGMKTLVRRRGYKHYFNTWVLRAGFMYVHVLSFQCLRNINCLIFATTNHWRTWSFRLVKNHEKSNNVHHVHVHIFTSLSSLLNMLKDTTPDMDKCLKCLNKETQQHAAPRPAPAVAVQHLEDSLEDMEHPNVQEPA